MKLFREARPKFNVKIDVANNVVMHNNCLGTARPKFNVMIDVANDIVMHNFKEFFLRSGGKNDA